MRSALQSTPTLEFLAEQALPKLGKKDPSEKDTRESALASFFRRGGTWKDIFDAADVGAERNLIAARFVAEDTKVLDVGCGKGFFTFAAALRAARVTAIDLMDGGGRAGWWDEFERTSAILGCARQVAGIRANATSIPLKRDSLHLVASVHSVRNFGSVQDIRGLFREAKRVLGRDGRLVVVESDVHDPRSPGYQAFYSVRTKMGWELELPTAVQMARMLEAEGFSEISQEFMETDLEYAPIYFPCPPSMPKEMKDGYRKAERLLRDEAEKPPRIWVVSGNRKS